MTDYLPSRLWLLRDCPGACPPSLRAVTAAGSWGTSGLSSSPGDPSTLSSVAGGPEAAKKTAEVKYSKL